MKKFLFALSFAASLSFVSIASYADNSWGRWRKDGIGWWYEIYNVGYFANAWFQDDDSSWYYFNNNGYMVTNQWVGDYYLGPSGAMLTDTVTPDGYFVDSSGKWVNSNTTVLSNGTYYMDFSEDPRDYSYNLSGNALSLSGDMYNYNNDSFIGFKTLSYNLSNNISYNTKYKLGASVPVSRQEFIDFYNQYGPERIVFSVEGGTVISISLIKFR